MINYFRELLKTLKEINQNLIAIRGNSEALAKCTSTNFGSGKNSIRTVGPHN